MHAEKMSEKIFQVAYQELNLSDIETKIIKSEKYLKKLGSVRQSSANYF